MLLPDTFEWIYEDPANPSQFPTVDMVNAMSGMVRAHEGDRRGTDQTMTVEFVIVWQQFGAGNLIR